jgi:hypothetical protein
LYANLNYWSIIPKLTVTCCLWNLKYYFLIDFWTGKFFNLLSIKLVLFFVFFCIHIHYHHILYLTALFVVTLTFYSINCFILTLLIWRLHCLISLFD